MRDAFRVSGLQGVGDLDTQLQQLAGREGLGGDAVLQRLPFQKLHDDEGPAFIFADVVDGADVGVVEGGGGARFALEALERLAIARKLLGQKLQGDAAAEARVFGLVNHAHAAAPELLNDAIVGNGLADHDPSPMRRSRSWKRGSPRRLSNRGSTLIHTRCWEWSS